MQPTAQRNDDLIRFRAPMELKERLRRAAEIQGKSMSDLLRGLVQAEAETEQPQAQAG